MTGKLEILLIVLFVVVLVMAEVLRQMRKKSGAKQGRGPGKSSRSRTRGVQAARLDPRVNYSLAPKKPEVLAGMMFDLLGSRLNYKQMLTVADLIADPGLTERYIELLASRKSTAELADEFAYLANSMEANDFSPQEREQVSTAFRRKVENEYKLLKIHKNIDKIL